MGQDAAQLRSEIEGVRDDLGLKMDAIGDKVSPRRMVERRKARARDRMRSVRSAVMGSVPSGPDLSGSMSGATTRLNDGASSVRDSAASAGGAAVDRLRQMPDAAGSQVQGNPIAAGLIAFGAGLLVAALIPPSDPEQRMAHAVVERAAPLKDQAMGAAQDLRGELTEAAKYAASEVKDRATDAVEEVRNEATANAQDLSGQARQATQEVQQQVRSPGDS